MTLTSTDRTSRPWTFAASAGVATYALSLALVLPRRSTSTDAFVAGELVVPALIGFVAGGFLGSVLQGRWRSVAPWLAPPLVAAVVIAVTQGKELVNEADRRAAEGEYARSHIVVKDSVLGWRKVDDPTASQGAEAMAEQLVERAPDSTFVWGSYVKGDDRMAFTGTSTGEGDGMRAELERSPQQALIDYMAGAGVSDPSQIETSIEGIELSCDDLNVSTVACAWADLTSIGSVVWTRDGGLDIDEGASLTEDLLEEIRVVDELPN